MIKIILLLDRNGNLGIEIRINIINFYQGRREVLIDGELGEGNIYYENYLYELKQSIKNMVKLFFYFP